MAGGRWSCSAKLWQWEANLWHQLLHQNNRRQAVSVNNIAVKQCGWVHASEERVDSCACAGKARGEDLLWWACRATVGVVVNLKTGRLKCNKMGCRRERREERQ